MMRKITSQGRYTVAASHGRQSSESTELRTFCRGALRRGERQPFETKKPAHHCWVVRNRVSGQTWIDSGAVGGEKYREPSEKYRPIKENTNLDSCVYCGKFVEPIKEGISHQGADLANLHDVGTRCLFAVFLVC